MFFISFIKRPKVKLQKTQGKVRNLQEDKVPTEKSKRIPVVILFLALITALFAVWAVYRVNLVPEKAYCEAVGEYSLAASTDYERERFFSQFGFTAESAGHCTVRIPSQGKVAEEYAALQKSLGLDLKPYMGKQARQYTLRLTDEKTGEETFGVLTVYRDRVVAVHLTDFIPLRPAESPVC